MSMYDVTIIGAAILDVLARPIDPEQLRGRSYPAEQITLNVGGDAANEATTLAHLGRRVNLISKFGDDLAGQILRQHFQKLGVSTADSAIEHDLDTGINLVMVHPDAERSFVTNRNGSLRRLALEDIPPAALSKSPIVSFASIFVSPLFTVPAMAQLFRSVKEQGCTLCADMTRAKNGETLADIREALAYVDYLFPNYEEARAVSHLDRIEDIADAFLDCGVGCVVIKTGAAGCFAATGDRKLQIPAFPPRRCIDTTGAGDNFAAGFLYALGEGKSPEDCARFACAAASLAVEAVGASDGVQSLAQVQERMRTQTTE